MRWFYRHEGRAVGPLDEAAMESLIAGSVVQRDTRVWAEADHGDAAAEFSLLAKYFSTPSDSRLPTAQSVPPRSPTSHPISGTPQPSACPGGTSEGQILILLPNDVSMVLRWIPPNRAAIQDDRSAQGFYIGQTPVTQMQWNALMGKEDDFFGFETATTGVTRLKCEGPSLPAAPITFLAAMEFIKRLASIAPEYEFDVPSSEEWEYACRAGTTTKYYTGDTPDDLSAAGWFYSNTAANEVASFARALLVDMHFDPGCRPQPVAQKIPNAWGLYDMHGNVFEWCRDVVKLTYGLIRKKTIDARVIRGGCCLSKAEECGADTSGFALPDASSLGKLRILTGMRVIARPLRRSS